MIEKRITPELLEAEYLGLTEGEQAALSLPEHSTTIDLELEGEPFKAQWSGRSRHLTGDLLTERLQDYGQINGLLHLRLVDDVYRLTLLPPGATMNFRDTATVKPPVVDNTSTGKAKKRRATVDRQFHADSEYDWTTSPSKKTGFLTDARHLLGDQIKAAGWDARELVELRLQGEELATLDDFEELLAVDVSNVDRMPHQEAAARHALSRLRGRAVLADEVGLGKTIEAGLAVKELTLRGLAKRVLILCPAPLREQWKEEMNTKFDLTFDVAYRGPQIGKQEKLVLSLTLATTNITALTKEPWDIVIVDEAHRAAGAGARKRRELITALTTACRYAFFLTATPVQNDLLELYRLVELLRPGTFRSVNDFKRQYMNRYDPRTPNDPAALRRLISSAMIRTTRAQAGIDRVQRRAEDVPITLGAREQELYALSTQLLRNVMCDPADTMRRRSLALRLTASPFSMGTTAMRMAERHGDDRVRRVLTEVGHLAMDIKGSARENKAVKITRDWVHEHGRVLIFTQHTDTVTGLLRRMDAEGLAARSFHGSMSPTERAKTIAAFRSGDAPVMISTDAGAEGQNLQFCNCVINYDLPWNPMRIEQRIGRVDRLTQPKDEVHIANLYARGTIDENVYRLLAKKLRMFELLFGQVTTILGELDDSKSASFETRVMEALFADNDAKMGRLLADLGTELEDARERASTLIAADSGLSSWMSTAFEHRKGLTKAGASDLTPAVSAKARMRQRRVQTWVRNVLKALDAELLHDTGDGDGAFLTAKFDEELTDELGGRTVLHLAFDRLGMDHHPDAELCAVGSPVFDELLGLLRMRGDLHATVPVIPEDLGPSPLQHAESTILVRRRLVPSGNWSGQATFRATVGEAETAEHIITVGVNRADEVRLPRRPLQDGETLPSAFGMPTKVIAKFEREAITHLEALRRDRAKQIERDQGAELKRIRDGYTAQIDEAASEDRVRLRRALNSEEKRLGRQPDVRSRAKLLAVTLDEDDWLVEETWQGPSGRERSISYEWGLGDPPEVDSDASQQPIRVLALCSEDHFVDASENTHCPSCDSDRCDACGEDAVLADCLVCGADSCGACRSTTGGLCLRCGAPERAPEFDRDHSVAWRLNGGVILHVGERVAELVHSDAAVSATIAHDDDVADRGRTQMRAYAKANGLPLDSGLVLRELFGSADVTEPPLDVVELRSDRTVSVELTTASAASSAIANAALPHLPKHSTASVHRAREFGLEGVLERLRRDAPPPAPPAVMITRRAQLTTYHLERDRVVERHATVDDGDRLVVRAERQVPLGWHAPSLDDPTFATAQIGRQHVSIERRNEALLVTSKDSLTRTRRQWVATPEATTAALQFDWFYVLSELGNSGGRMGKRRTEPAAMADCFPSPTECALGDRSIEQVVELTSASADMDLVPADKSMLPPIDQLSTESRKDVPTALPPALAHALLERSSQPFTTAALGGFEVHETWVGHGTAEHRYEAFDAQPLAPYLDDTGARSDDFGVCRDGHYYASGSAARCASCDTWACRTCDEQDHQASIECGTCSAQVCRRCLSAEHAVSPTRCVLCNDAACADCGRDPVVDACTLCARPMCDGCRRGNLCPACNEFTPASDEFLRTLPSELAALGATALTGSDDHATTLLMNRNGGIEQAVLRAGAVERWVAFGRNELGSSYKLRIAASREFRCRIVHSERHTAPEPPMRVPRLTIQSERRFRADWEVAELQRSGHGSGLFADVAGDLADAVLGDFSSGALPVPVPETPAEVPSALAKLAHPRTLVLETHWTRVGFDCSIVGEGILRREIDGADVRESTTPWGTHGAEPTWIGREWNPAPTVIRWASIDGADVAVVKLASLLAIGVHTGDYTAWYRIISSRDAPAATALARSNGLPDADAVTVFTDPVRITRSTVSNAVDADLTVQPAIKFSSRPVDPGPTTERAITAWVPDARVAVPLLIKLPNNLRTELTRVLQPNGVVVTSIEIGAMVKEVVTVQSGQIWQYDAHLSPGEHDARRKDSKTRVARDDGILDREGHYGADDTHCPYCADAVCALCQNGLRTCDCCGVTICRICLREPQQDLWLCPACAGVRPPTRAEAREHGRLMLTRGMLIGTDDKHVVVVERSKQNWVRHGDDGTKHPLASPSLVHYFGERLS